MGILILGAVLWYVFLVPTPARVTSSVSGWIVSRKYDEARQQLNLARLKAFSDNDRSAILGALAAIETDAKDYAAAKKYYIEAEKYNISNYGFFESEAYMYELSGDKSKAIACYQKALDIISKKTTGVVFDRQYLIDKIAELKQ